MQWRAQPDRSSLWDCRGCCGSSSPVAHRIVSARVSQASALQATHTHMWCCAHTLGGQPGHLGADGPGPPPLLPPGLQEWGSCRRQLNSRREQLLTFPRKLATRLGNSVIWVFGLQPSFEPSAFGSGTPPSVTSYSALVPGGGGCEVGSGAGHLSAGHAYQHGTRKQAVQRSPTSQPLTSCLPPGGLRWDTSLRIRSRLSAPPPDTRRRRTDGAGAALTGGGGDGMLEYAGM
jgi:hypothetical protein